MLLVNTYWFIGTVVATVFVILYPIVLAIIAHQRLKVSWRYFGYGALIFFLFQIITRVPLVIWIQGRIAPELKASPSLRFAWIMVLVVTAGLFEEIGRYVGYRWLMRREEKTWSKGVMYGIGHGGLESMLFVGGSLLLTLYNIVLLSITGMRLLPVSQRILAFQRLASINAQPAWTALLPAWERLWTVPVHIALSVIVLQVFLRRNILWLWLAVLLHAMVDFTAAILPVWLGSSLNTSLIVEGAVMIFGLLGLWVVWRLRSSAAPTVTEGGVPEPTAPDSTVPSTE
jgi:uncharacterized membrane protein YhfC